MKKVEIPNKKVIFVLLILVLVFLSSGCLEHVKIPKLNIKKSNSIDPYPLGNLTRTDVATIPVLAFAIDEVLTSNSTDQKDYTITQEEWDKIDQFFDDMNLPPTGEGRNSWYISFEGTILEIFLTHLVS